MADNTEIEQDWNVKFTVRLKGATEEQAEAWARDFYDRALTQAWREYQSEHEAFLLPVGDFASVGEPPA